MREDWTREEVEAAVADYFNMLNKDLRGQPYSKAEHRRNLAAMLNNRSAGSIERKHQNISAVLLKLGFPYITGYKPLRNYQQLLFDVVSDRLSSSRSLLELVRKQVESPANVPVVEDISNIEIELPSGFLAGTAAVPFAAREPHVLFKVDYITREARNRSLGMAGEQFVLRFEKARLTQAGRPDLAAEVEHVAATEGDSAGFDVLSFDTTGRERYIEVKTTAYGPFTPFFVTDNELKVSRRVDPDYYLYRTFDFRRQPKLFYKPGSLDRSFNFALTEYLASLP